jgi:hypothetical protein
MTKLKMFIFETSILMLYKNRKVEVNFIFFKTEPLKLKVFDI